MSLTGAASAAYFRYRKGRLGANLSRVETRHHALDLLRGIAALGIAAYHFLASQGVAIQSLGTFGVYVFFVLSGLTMMLVYGDRFSNVIAGNDVVFFVWNRISRIIPLLAAAALAGLVFAAPAIGWNHHLAARALQSFLTGSGLFALHLPGYLSTVTGAWSLGIEMFFYLLFPVICLLTARARMGQLAITALMLVFAQQIVLAILQHWAREDFARFWHYYTTPLVFAPFFVFGIIAFRLRLERTHANLVACLICILAIATFSVLFTTSIFESHCAYLVLSAFAFMAVLLAYNSSTPHALVPVAAFLGNASYALYLTHPFCLSASQALSDAFGLGAILTAALFFSLSLGVAHCSFVFFEAPAQRYLRALLERRRTASATLVDASLHAAGRDEMQRLSERGSTVSGT